MKRSSLVLLLVAAFCIPHASAQTPRVATVAAGPDTVSRGSMKLPTTRPGSYIAGTRPLVPPPPMGFPELVLPPSPAVGYPPVMSAVAPAEIDDGHGTLEPIPSAKKKKRSTDVTSEDADAPAAPAPRKPSNVFLSRDALQKTRDKCQVQVKGGELKFVAQGGEKEIRLSIIGGRSCVKAISPSDDWLTVSALGSNDEVTVSVPENEEPSARDGVIVIANTGSSVHIKVHQEPNTSGFRRIEL